ncbi:chitinase [Providencia vermicola]|uniref:chitinase n=1 Tax=Providencia vermicola TaxID=333965 RepID=UPI0034D3E1DF
MAKIPPTKREMMMNKTLFAPYFDVTVDAIWNDPLAPNGKPNPKYSQAAISHSVDGVYLAFLTADPNNNAAWGAYSSMPISWAKPFCDALIEANIKVIVSFGGAANYDVSARQTVDQLIATYQEVIDILGASQLDFDFENDLYDADKTFTALSTTVKNNPDITLSLTLPVMPYGLVEKGLALVQKSVNAGLKMKVNGMAMDYGQGTDKNMGQAAADVATSLKGQLKTYYPTLTDAELYDLVQVTPMIGLNDDRSMFNFNDINTLSNFSKTNGVNLISMWSLTRDRVGVGEFASASNSGNPEQTKDFEYTERFTNALK